MFSYNCTVTCYCEKLMRTGLGGRFFLTPRIEYVTRYQHFCLNTYTRVAANNLYDKIKL